MDAERWRHVTGIFHAALTRDTADRGAFLRDACEDDSTLLHEVEGLIAAHEAAGALGDQIAIRIPPDLVQSDRVFDLYDAALQRPPGESSECLPEACKGDQQLRDEVASWLRDAPGSLQLLDRSARAAIRFESGRTLGTYRIEAFVGAGGMGEVYRATDTKLGRFVALKILPSAFAHDAERSARFEHEARILAALNHPHIAHIYGFEQADGFNALVMELVEGPTLADRIAEAAIPVHEALQIGGQMADALEAAHEQGIIHCDLKPANIKVRPDGAVKVLDFGVAKAFDGASSAAAVSESLRLSLAATDTGVIMGTPAYMSPEQVQGKRIDKRTDIWAFGCVLYEMLVGRPAFDGETVPDTVAAVMRREPDWDALPSDLPAMLQMFLRRCLHKNPRERVHDMADIRLAVGGAFDVVAVSPGRRSAHIKGWIAASLVLAMVAAGSVFWRLRPTTTTDSRSVRFTIEPPPMLSPFAMAISPDGRTVAFAARSGRPGSTSMLFVRDIGSLEVRKLPGTERAMAPFWSPDSRHLGFATLSTPRQLKTIEISEGRPQLVCDLRVGNPVAGTWNSDDEIVFSDNDSLYRVPAAGGKPTLLRQPDHKAGETMLGWPQFLPDGRHYLYFALNTDRANHAVVTGSLDTDQQILLMRSESNARFARPDFLLFTRQQTLLAQRFDSSTRRLVGQPMAIADGLLYRADIGRAAFAVSDTGTLIYRSGGTETGQRSLVWIDRSGIVSGPLGVVLTETGVRLSPDGKRVAFAESGSDIRRHIWIYDIERNQKAPLTTDPAVDQSAVWSPDGSRVAFGSSRNDRNNQQVLHQKRDDGVTPGRVLLQLEKGADAWPQALYERRADGATPQRLLLPQEEGIGVWALDWTSNFIIFAKRKPGEPTVEIWVRPLSGNRKPFRYLSRLSPTNAVLSPNGRWLAYVANHAGTNQVVVQSFPDPSKSRQQISTSGGAFPRWRRDGHELFYLDSDWRLIAVPVGADGKLGVENSAVLFAPPGSSFPPNTVGYSYDVTADGQHFLFSVASAFLEPTVPITVLLHWTAAFKQ